MPERRATDAMTVMRMRGVRLLLAGSAMVGVLACTERVPTSPSQTSTPSSTTPSTTAPGCTYEISPGSRIHGPGAETGTVTVTTSSTCTWTAASSADWIAVASGATGTGSSVVSYAVQANGGDGRTGLLTIAGRAFTVEQAVNACRFDDFSRWRVQQARVSTGTVRASGQRVELRVVTGQDVAGIVSPCALQGDFDIQVDFEWIREPAGNTYGLRMGVWIGSGFLTVNRTPTPSHYSLYLGSTLIPPNIPTSDARGQLRLARTGASTAGFHWSGSGWIRLGAVSLGTSPTQIYLDLSSALASTPSETVVAFQNFRVNSGTPAN